ncbi:sensor histidine kinase [Mangrovibacterium marinum]|nr:histidine kinase [Mangrovibacterium marinum]
MAFSIHDKWIKWLLHSIAWVIVVIIPLYIDNAFGDGNLHRVYGFYLHTATAALIFYLGYLWLVPSFYLKERQITYFVILVAIIIGTYYISSFIEQFWFDDMKRIAEEVDKDQHIPRKVFGIFNHSVSSVLLSGFAMGLGVLDKLKQNEKRQKELEKEKLNSELAFLKSQVSPHFFFNTLNNIYTLIGIDTDEAQEAVLKLSKLMRYLLYDSEEGNSSLQEEISFMNNYIDLMKLRISSKVDLKISLPDSVPEISIAPLLFIAFIENAFKHGISYREHSFIEIGMDVDQETIRFETRNSIGKTSTEGEGRHSGIGLENVKKRLTLLYPGKHELRISRTNDTFRVKLEINLQ